MSTARVIPPNNPTYEQVTHQILQVRQAVKESCERQYRTLSLVQYLEWAKEIVEKERSIPNNKIRSETYVYEALAKYKGELVQRFRSILQSPDEILAKPTISVGQLKHKIDTNSRKHEREDEEKLIIIMGDVLSLIEKPKKITAIMIDPLRNLLTRQMGKIKEEVNLAMSKAKDSKKSMEPKNTISMEMYLKIDGWINDTKQLISKSFNNQDEIEKLTEEIQDKMFRDDKVHSLLLGHIHEEINITAENPSHIPVKGSTQNILAFLLRFKKKRFESFNKIHSYIIHATSVNHQLGQNMIELLNEVVNISKVTELYHPLFSFASHLIKDIKANIERDKTNQLPSDVPPTSLVIYRGIDFGYSYQSQINIPSSLTTLNRVMSHYEYPKSSCRKLTWKFDMGNAEVAMNGFGDEPIILTVNPIQMVILSLFNENESMTYKEVRQTLKGNEDVRTSLIQLLTPSETADSVLHFYNDGDEKNVNSLKSEKIDLKENTLIIPNDHFWSKSNDVKVAAHPKVKQKSITRKMFNNPTHAVSFCILKQLMASKTKTMDIDLSKPETYNPIIEKTEKYAELIKGYAKPSSTIVKEGVESMKEFVKQEGNTVSFISVE